jgi:hypothetical protein
MGIDDQIMTALQAKIDFRVAGEKPASYKL